MQREERMEAGELKSSLLIMRHGSFGLKMRSYQYETLCVYEYEVFLVGCQ
jgi:hypothetical protein